MDTSSKDPREDLAIKAARGKLIGKDIDAALGKVRGLPVASAMMDDTAIEMAMLSHAKAAVDKKMAVIAGGIPMDDAFETGGNSATDEEVGGLLIAQFTTVVKNLLKSQGHREAKSRLRESESKNRGIDPGRGESMSENFDIDDAPREPDFDQEQSMRNDAAADAFLDANPRRTITLRLSLDLLEGIWLEHVELLDEDGIEKEMVDEIASTFKVDEAAGAFKTFLDKAWKQYTTSRMNGRQHHAKQYHDMFHYIDWDGWMGKIMDDLFGGRS